MVFRGDKGIDRDPGVSKRALSSHNRWFESLKSRPNRLEKEVQAPKYGCGELVRDFINAELYAPDKGYFNLLPSINRPSKPLEFNQMRDMQAYNSALRRLYAEGEFGWTTPVEIFQPWYAQSIANWALATRERHGETGPLVFVEIGGGNGTCAEGVLDYIADTRPDLYPNTYYAIADISHKMIALQTERLGRRHANHAVSVLSSAADLDLGESLPPDTVCYVVGLEVLDNMAHDKVAELGENGDVLQCSVWEDSNEALDLEQSTRLSTGDASDQSGFVEAWSPVEDAWIQRIVQLRNSYQNSRHGGDGFMSDGFISDGFMSRFGLSFQGLQRAAGGLISAMNDGHTHAFVPTTCLQFLVALQNVAPRHHLLLADFDFLPKPIDYSENSPIVSERFNKGADGNLYQLPVPRDVNTYLLPCGSADIFFPTNFKFLQHMYSSTVAAARRDGTFDGATRVLGQGEFLSEFSVRPEATRLANGVDAAATDYGNMKFFIGSSSNS